ncbi:dienelactone hydrolase family protein [soil metagenome]
MKTTLRLSAILLIGIFSATIIDAQPATIPYADGSQKLNGELSVPKNHSKKNAGILILPAWMGIDANARQSANQLSAIGYYTFIADIYGEGNYPKSPKDAGAQAGFYKKNIADYQRRIRLALDQLIKAGADSSNIVVIGYCFGGTGALEAARSGLNVKGVVAIHGGLSRDTTRTIQPITTRVLVLHGADDPTISQKEILAFQNEMRTAKADWEMIYYANAVHAFTDRTAGNDNSKGVAYNEVAAKRSWSELLRFLNEVLE